MSYNGGILPDSDDQHISGILVVLKAALCEVPLEAPYRGAASFQKGGYLYENKIDGDIMSFYGTEAIRMQGQAIYQLRYTISMLKS